jgi:hypothetical protein
MSPLDLRREIKQAVDKLPAERLASLADYIHFLSRPSLPRELKQAEDDISAGRGVDWRTVRDDV